MNVASAYPSTRIARDRFVLDRRAPRPRHDPWRHQGVHVEDERSAGGTIVRAATIFLTGRECPWRCAMCDLWQHTIEGDTPPGALVQQIDAALAELSAIRGQRPVTHVKLYNAGSFFDPRAVPEEDYDAIARRLASFDRVIVESHPALVGPRTTRLAAALASAAASERVPDLEIAMGLETANPDALDRLNKGFTLDDFAGAADRLRSGGASLRVFLLVGVPFIPADEQQDWIARSVSFAFECGATAVSLIPTRPGNGALEAIGFEPPALADLETALERSLRDGPGRVFADIWDLGRFAGCQVCFDARHARLHRMNLTQRVEPPLTCSICETTTGPVAFSSGSPVHRHD